MKTVAKVAIGLAAGIPAALILIGLIGLMIKFFMRRCHKKAWNDIKTQPRVSSSSKTSLTFQKEPRRQSSERQPLYTATNNALDCSVSQLYLPVDENNIVPNQNEHNQTEHYPHTLVQFQCDRLSRLKENFLKSEPRLGNSEHDIQGTIDQAQKEFDESAAGIGTERKG